MMFSMSGTPVYAADMETGASAVCPHHVHDETCGYSEGTPCTHEHTDDCYTLVTQCVHEHTAECYSDGMLPAEVEEKAADACTHVCSEESGCITKELNCPHVHDETCGYSEGSPCTFDPSDCELCNPTDSGEPEGPAECTCETLCTADSVNPDYPVCSAEGADLTACAGTVEEGDAAPQTVTAWAVEGDVTYLYYDTNTKTWQTGTISSGDYTTASFTASSWGTAGNTTWYVANSTGNIAGRNTIQVNGDVRLILAAGSNISLIDIPLNITDGSSLTIYGQDSSSGRLSVTPFSGSAITLGSGSSLTIHSGNLTLQTGLATGISVGSGTLTIYGGSVSTISNPPGISVSSGGTLNIYGGTLTSRDIYAGTGSITGEAGSSININGNAVITGNISGADNDDSWNAIINSTVYGTVTNCYSDTKVVGNQGGKVNGGGVKDAGAFASGEVAYLLNGSSSDSPVWYQNLDNGQTVDSYPVLDSSHGTVYCIEGDPASYSNDPNGNPAQVISVDIAWGELSFTYSDGTWNPDTHTYDGAGWNVDEEGGNSIKVENTGNTDVNVTYEYKAEETGITGSFTDGETPVSAPVALPANNSSTVYLILAGKPGKELEKAIIGRVTVTIGGESE